MEEIKLADVHLKIDNQIADIEITRGDKLNALNSQVIQQLYQCFDTVSKRPDVRVVVLSGEGDKAFAAGADLKEVVSKTNIDQLREYYASFDWLYSKMAEVPQPIIAKVKGYAFGGGCLLALAADMIVATRDALFSQPEINFGFTGGAALLPKLIGRHKAAELTMMGSNITAEEAYRLNLVNRLTEKEEIDEAVRKICNTLIKKDAFALSMVKKIIKTSMDSGLNIANNYETECSAVCLAREESKSSIIKFISK